MTRQRILTLAIVSAGISLAASGVWFKWRSDRDFFQPALLLSRFPSEDAAVLNVDFAAVRAAGLLAPSKAALEPEYQAFLAATGFDYRRDLDLAIASFSNSGNFIIARGRFNWDKLSAYAASQGGSCYQDLCRMPGSTPARHISFLPLRTDTIALAVSTDDLAASRLSRTGQPVTTRLPDAPVWLSIPGAVLRQQTLVPPGLRLTFSALTSADRVMVTLGVTLGPSLEARLDAQCHTLEDARVLASQLRTATAIVKQGIAQSKIPPTDGLARFLSSGSFEESGQRVNGRWPVGKDLIESLTSGI